MPFDDQQRAFLHDLLAIPAPSGFEAPAARRWRAQAELFARTVDHDLAGNSWATAGGRPSGMHIVVEGHIDEIGFVVTWIDERGFLWVGRIGGWDAQVVVGQRVVIQGRDGPVRGVIGRKAAHLLKPADRDRGAELGDLWIDIGASDRDAAHARVEVGDPAVLDVPPLELQGELLASRSIDNRIGAFIALEAVREAARIGTPHTVTALAASQEEITMAGAIAAAHRLRPDVVIALDVTHATDYPGADPKGDNDVKLGGGPVFTRGASVNARVFDALRDAALAVDVPFQIQAAGKSTGTDADGFRSSGIACAIGLVSIPNRYMHSPNELIDLRDVDGAIRTIARFIADLTPGTDLRD